jgi:hypothetical protein
MIISLMILLAILLGFAFIGALTLRGEEGGVVVSMHEGRARAAASACMESAIDRLGRDVSYTGDETVDLGGGLICTIRPILTGSDWTIEVEASVQGAVARQRVVLSARNPVTIDSWEEVASF